MINPHFDEDRVVWKNEYSGKYSPPPDYSNEFELQWKLAVENIEGYFDNPGASTEDIYIRDRVYEWTGKALNKGGMHDKRLGARKLDNPIDGNLIKGKKCIDIGCGLGRWTRTMQMIGAESVLSIDMSASALKNVSRYNDNVVKANIMNIPGEHPEWVESFDFACFWGVAMCTHDPRKAFTSAASTVKPGGAMYLMVYCPEGQHNSKLVKHQRKIFHSLGTIEEKLDFLEHVYKREWDANYGLYNNIRNLLIKTGAVFVKGWRDTRVGFLDLLEPYYNWVIPKDAIAEWMSENGFGEYKYLYRKPKSAYHILAIKSKVTGG